MSSSKASTWEKTRASSKKFFDKVGVPVNKAANKLGAEAFWPTSLDKESDKAARILRSFCIDGFVAKEDKHGEAKSKRDLDHIPAEVCCSVCACERVLIQPRSSATAKA